MDEVKEEEKPKLRKLEYGTPYWEQLANRLARSWLQINPCRDCGGPVVDGYCCTRCGSSNP